MNIEETAREYVKKCSTYIELDPKALTSDINKFYELYGHQKPKRITVVDDPQQIQKTCQRLLGNNTYNSVLTLLGEKSRYLYSIDYHQKNNTDVYEKIKNKLSSENLGKATLLIKLMDKGIWQMAVLDEECVICPAPNAKYDEQRHIHSVTGMAVEWPGSGYGMYAIHGIVFEKELFWNVTKRKLTPQQVLNIENIEQRRVTINHYGWDKIFEALDSKLLDTYVRRFTRLPEGGFYRVDDGDIKITYRLYNIKNIVEGIDVLLVTYTDPSTGRFYADTVWDTNPYDDDRKIKTAYDAMAYKLQMSRKEYLQVLRLEA